MARTEELVKGVINEPVFIEKLVEMTEEDKLIWKQMWSALVHNLAHESETSSVFWMEKFSNSVVFNQIIKHLSQSGWVSSNVTGNFATMKINKEKLYEWIQPEEVEELLKIKKLFHYEYSMPSAIHNDMVQIGHKWRSTGLIREGFRKAGNFEFTFDVEALKKFKTKIIEEATKSLVKSTKETPYEEVVTYLIEEEMFDPKVHTLGPNVSDSRGRSIFQCSKKVFNVVGDKRARALVVTPFSEPLTKEGRNSVYEAIAELCSIRGKNHEDKIQQGMNMWITHIIPEDCELDQKIWLTRIYEALDHPEKEWDVPVEFDATASMLQMTAALTNNHKLMDYTNLSNPDEFKDAWTVEGLSRNKVKKATTPHLYGSNAEPAVLWTQHKMEYSQEEVNIITEEIHNGRFKEANEFKSFIISNVNTMPKMMVKIGNNEFEIECNRFKPQRLVEKVYWVYSSKTNHLEKVVNHIEQEPDLEAFHRYFQTLLLHNLDSQIADYICNNLRWVLPNHDAWVLHPNDVALLRKLYTEKLFSIYTHRHTILAEYFKSIGIEEWNKDMDVDKEEVNHFEPWCLK